MGDVGKKWRIELVVRGCLFQLSAGFFPVPVVLCSWNLKLEEEGILWRSLGLAWQLKVTKICPQLSRSSLGGRRFSEGAG